MGSWADLCKVINCYYFFFIIFIFKFQLFIFSYLKIFILKKYNIVGTPITPSISSELMSGYDLNVDGSLIEKFQFSYNYPKINENDILEMINYFIDMKLFPPTKEDDDD